jgi:hypothetical protein
MFLVPAILAMLPATVLLGAQAGLAEPTGCKTKPHSSAPRGAHWFYRVDPRDNQRCWFLSHEGAKARLHARDGTQPSASVRPRPRRENGAKAVQTAEQIASAQGPSAESLFIATSVGEHETSIDFAARWPDFPKSLNLDGRKLATASKAFTGEADGSEPLPLIPPHGMVAFMPAVSAAALVLLLAAALFLLARRRKSDHREHWGATAGRRRPRQQLRPGFVEMTGRMAAAGARRVGSVWQPPEPTDPAQDLKRSLRELIGDLQRAGAASGSLRSYAPSAGCHIVSTRRPVPDLSGLTEVS